MSRKWIIASILIVVLLALCGASLYVVWQGARMVETSGIDISIRDNSVKAESVEEKTLRVNGPVILTLNNDIGDVTVATGTDGQVKIVAEKTAWGADEAEAQKELEELVVLVEQDGDTVDISLQRPDQMNVLNLRPDIWSVEFTITVPAEASVTLDSSNGDLVLSGITGDADLQTGFGDIEVSGLSGAVILKTTNGNITATDINSKGDVSLTSEFGNITAERISAANGSIGSTNGLLNIREIDASGDLKIGSDFGSISLVNSKAGTVEIRSTNGKITLENVDVEGTVTIHNDFGDQTLNAVDASIYDLKSRNGRISLNQARGSVTAQSDFGDVEALNVEDGTINLSSKNGAVTFSGSLAAGPHSITSDFGNVTLTLPGETGLDIDLQTSFGKISSDFEITVSGALENKHWVGKFNGGGEQLTVKTNNGNITIHSK
jgi:DUF4097 and DUF4098 domain-containing protein YvlB